MTTALTDAQNAGQVPRWTLGDRMRKALEHAGISVQGMADYLGVARNTVSTWIHDRVTPDTRTLRLWALATGIDYQWIVTGEAETRPDDGEECAVRDSNPEPADYPSAQVITLRAA